MIAVIYPILRMPRTAAFFDYHIPDSLSDLRPGEMVSVPFRREIVLGIVKEIKPKSNLPFALKSILARETRAQFSSQELACLEALARECVLSVPSFLHSILPTFPKRTIAKATATSHAHPLTLPAREQASLTSLVSRLSEEQGTASVTISDLKRMTCVLMGVYKKQPRAKLIVVCSTVLDAERVAAHLPASIPHWLYTGAESMTNQFSAWSSFRASETGILVGTKNALFCANESVTGLFLFKARHTFHSHHEQQPYFHAPTTARFLAESFNLPLFLFDVTHTVEDVSRVYPKTSLLHYSQTLPMPRVVDMAQQQQTGGYIGTWISFEAFHAIEEAQSEQKRILLVFNKKGRAKELYCADCKTVAKCSACEQSLIRTNGRTFCPACRLDAEQSFTCRTCSSTDLKERFFGNEKVEELLRTQFPDARIARFDKDHPELDALADILLTTSYYLEQHADAFQPETFQSLVLLNADHSLHTDSIHATERTYYELEQWRSLAFLSKAELIIQTKNPALFNSYINHPTATWQKEADWRRQYDQPPFVQCIELRLDGTDPKKANHALQTAIQRYRAISPRVRMRKYQSGTEIRLELRFPPDERDVFLRQLSEETDAWRIDTHAQMV